MNQNMLAKAATLLAALAVTACAVPPTTKTVELHTRFDEQEAARLLQSGRNTVKGSGLLRQMNGGVVTCAGQEVFMVPATRYAQERIVAIYGSGSGGYSPASQPRVTFVGDVPTYQTLRHTTRCDAQGYFKFDKIADGAFYVFTAIMWQVPSGIGSGLSTQGGGLLQRVEVAGGETKEIVLTAQ